MATFSYRAIAGSGLCSGTVDADSPFLARESLRSRGLTIVEMSAASDDRRSGSLLNRSRLNPREAVSVLREFSTLLAVGVPLLQALESVSRQQRPRVAGVLSRVCNRVAAGRSLAEAVRDEPQSFDELCVAMIEAGETTGELDRSLERFTTFRERWQRLRGRVVSALLYPGIVLIMGIGVGVFLMTFVTPSLLDALQESGRELPMTTQVIRWISNALLGWWWLILSTIVLAVFVCRHMLRIPSVALRAHRAVLATPLLGSIVRRQEIVRFCVVTSALLRTGVPFTSSLAIAESTARNLVVRSALASCKSRIRAGADIADAASLTGVFPDTLIRVLGVGQATGRMEELLDRLADDYDQQVQSELQRLVSLLEPALIVLLASMIGTIAFATILPILEAGNVA